VEQVWVVGRLDTNHFIKLSKTIFLGASQTTKKIVEL